MKPHAVNWLVSAMHTAITHPGSCQDEFSDFQGRKPAAPRPGAASGQSGIMAGQMSKDRNCETEGFRAWTPDFDRWPKSWMGDEEDLAYGRELLPLFAEFLEALYVEGLSKKTFAQYRDHLWLLGGTIIRRVSLFEEYQDDPLEKLRECVADEGILPDHYDQMSRAELKAFERMCRKFQQFLGR